MGLLLSDVSLRPKLYRLWPVIKSHSNSVVNPSGEIIKEIFFPAKFMTCPTWGGERHNTLYLTSASGHAFTGETEEGDEGGNLFRVVFDGVTGMVKNEFAG